MTALRRATRWNQKKRNATPSQFRRMLPSRVDDGIRLAKFAGKRMAQHMAKANRSAQQWTVKDLDPLQVEVWRRRYGVPKNRVGTMRAVALARLNRWYRRHSLYKPKPRTEPRRVWRKASKAERKRKPRAASVYTCIHGKLYYRACPQCKRDKADGLGNLERLLAKHSKPLLRRLQNGPVNKKFWILVRRALGIKASVKPKWYVKGSKVIRVSAVRGFAHGGRTYRNYFRRQRQAVVACTRFLRRNRVALIGCAKPEEPKLKRLVSDKVAYSQTLCVDMDAMFHARCNRPVSRGVFCDVCSPKVSRS